jgi:L-asparaginase / beta-aspartyl-peptidase
MTNFGIAIHGGAGTILKSLMTEDRELAYKSGLENALNCGYEILEKGGSSLDAVEAAVKSLENCPLFNAGKGAVFNHDGKQEMDASIMDGTTLNAGAVASVRNVKNPVALARAIMDKSEHVFMCKEGAEQFAKSVGIEFAEDAYFFDAFRFEQYQQALTEDRISLDHSEGKKFGTVGAVALDQHGHLAAATSTGGMTNKKFGRIGDSSIIGAGTYANDATCAISCTGHGELFIRSVVAYDISCLMEYKGLSLAAACELVVQDKLVKIGGEGGLIAIDKMGSICLPFNSEGMYRASKNAQETLIAIYR